MSPGFQSSLSVSGKLGNTIFLDFTQGGPEIKSLFRDECTGRQQWILLQGRAVNPVTKAEYFRLLRKVLDDHSIPDYLI